MLSSRANLHRSLEPSNKLRCIESAYRAHWFHIERPLRRIDDLNSFGMRVAAVTCQTSKIMNKKNTIIGFTAVSILLAGCGRNRDSSSVPEPSPKTEIRPSPAGAAVAQPALTAWQQGDKSAAISSFVGADWSARPLFAPGSVLNLSEAQFKALPAADRETKSNEMLSQLASLKQLAAAVAQAGRDADSKGDTAQAQKYFRSLQQCGAALDDPQCLLIVQKVGKAVKEMADKEVTK